MKKNSIPKLTINDRIRLTKVRSSDLRACLRHLNTSDVFWQRTSQIPFPYRKTDFFTWIEQAADRLRSSPFGVTWAIREDDGLIGACGLFNIVRGHRAEIGYWLAEDYWGQGIMTAVVEAVCQHGWNELDLVRIHAHVMPDNAASARVLEKCGFQHEGRLRSYFRKGDNRIDADVFAQLRL